MTQPFSNNNYYNRNYNAIRNSHLYSYGQYRPAYGGAYSNPAPPANMPTPNIRRKPVPKRKPKLKINPLRILVSLCFFAAIVYYVIPYNFAAYFEPMVLNRFLNRNIAFNAADYVMPASKKISNATINGEKIFVPVRLEKKQMTSLTPSGRMHNLETDLIALAANYPNLTPSIYVWDYVQSKSAEINAGAVFSSASIIKLPILVELFRKSESLKNAGEAPIDLSSKLLFDEIHRTSGSGSLQYRKGNTEYTIDYLAKIMIQESDNSATNMLLEYIGGMDALNAASRKWGLPSTQISNWLPDLKGTNTVSAKDMATLLYNLDNPKFLNDRSRYYIKQYMSNVHNTTLLKAGLPENAEILHKTGDIGTMLGDAGIIYAPNGKKYIAVIMIKRPHNDYSARNFIQESSKIIYKSIVENSESF